jgi:hypothetical protein
MDKKDSLLEDSENLNKMVALIEALPQLKLRLPRPKNLNLGEVGEVPFTKIKLLLLKYRKI